MNYSLHVMPPDDPVRAKWIAGYTGVTTDGKQLPIDKVTPGMIMFGEASEYFEEEYPGQAQKCWEWVWTKPDWK